MSTFPFLPHPPNTTTTSSRMMITLLNPHRPALPTIPAPPFNRINPIPRVQIYNPAGKQLEVNLDLELKQDSILGHDVGTSPLGEVRDISPPVVRYRGQCYIWSMDDWWPMPAEMNLGPDDILRKQEVDELPERGPYDQVCGALSFL